METEPKHSITTELKKNAAPVKFNTMVKFSIVLAHDMGGSTFGMFTLTAKVDNFEVKAAIVDAHLGGEDHDNRVVDYCLQDLKRKKRGKDMAGNHRVIRCSASAGRRLEA